MRIQFLGTAAAEAWPALFCNCETCNRARKSGGKDLRSRSSLMIDHNYKIDLPPDTYMHVIRENLDLSALEAIFITHSHFDHLSYGELGFFSQPYAHNLKNAPIKVCGPKPVIDKIKLRRGAAVSSPDWPGELVELKVFEPYTVNHLTFTPVLAAHDPSMECFNYIVKSDSASVLYTADSGAYEQQTLDFLSEVKLDMLIAECTMGTLNFPPHGHMTFEAVVELKNKLVEYGSLAPDARTIITHFSHNIGLLHEELEAVAGPENIEVAYDGLVVEI